MNTNNEINQTSFQRIACPKCSSENVFLRTKLYSLQGETENHRKFSVGGWILLLAGLFILVRFGIWFFEGDLSFLQILPIIAAGFWMTRLGAHYALFFILNDKTKMIEKIKVRCSDCGNTWIEPLEKGMQLPPMTQSWKVLRIVLWIFAGLLFLLSLTGILMGISGVYD